MFARFEFIWREGLHGADGGVAVDVRGAIGVVGGRGGVGRVALTDLERDVRGGAAGGRLWVNVLVGVATGGLPFLPAVLEEGGRDVSGALVLDPDYAENDVGDYQGAHAAQDGDHDLGCVLMRWIDMRTVGCRRTMIVLPPVPVGTLGSGVASCVLRFDRGMCIVTVEGVTSHYLGSIRIDPQMEKVTIESFPGSANS